jgi:5-methylcytosine-specific restriction protein A
MRDKKMKVWQILPENNKVEQQRRKSSNFAWFYNSKQWKVARNKCLQEYPVCVICEEQGKTTPATTVNHITPMRLIVKSGATSIEQLRWSELKAATSAANLESLCHSCHGIEEAEMIKREKQQMADRQSEIHQKIRERKKAAIKREQDNWHRKKDVFSYKVGVNDDGSPIYMDIF